MTSTIRVRTGARLHFGLLATEPDEGPFGGIGMMVDRPGFLVQTRRSTRDEILSPPELTERIEKIIHRVRQRLFDPALPLQVGEPTTPVAIRVDEVIPSHRGFGSGTQLTFAVATALMQALDVPPAISLEGQLGRGSRSAVGTAGFREGGFVIDAGLRERSGLEAGVTRRDVPDEWRFVVIDPQGPSGPSGAGEVAGFRSLPPMPRHMPEALSDLIVQAILPGLARRDHLRFAWGVAEFNRLVGEHFAAAQGGIFAHPLIRELAKRLSETPWPYLAQSSWGPAAVVFCEDDRSADELVEVLGRLIPTDAASVFVARPLNRGAEVRRLD